VLDPGISVWSGLLNSAHDALAAGRGVIHRERVDLSFAIFHVRRDKQPRWLELRCRPYRASSEVAKTRGFDSRRGERLEKKRQVISDTMSRKQAAAQSSIWRVVGEGVCARRWIPNEGRGKFLDGVTGAEQLSERLVMHLPSTHQPHHNTTKCPRSLRRQPHVRPRRLPRNCRSPRQPRRSCYSRSTLCSRNTCICWIDSRSYNRAWPSNYHR
jgi:hypothetical protein